MLESLRRTLWRLQPAAPPSRSGQVVALLRAEIDRPHSPGGDPRAQQLLVSGFRPTTATSQRPGVAADTRLFDEQVQTAIASGVRQIVNCGSGYDDRALRFRAPGVRFFEFDLAGTLSDKASRLQAIGADTTNLTLRRVDFRGDDIATTLEAVGHDAGAPTLFLCERLLVFLKRTVIERLLVGLRTRAAEGSTLAATLVLCPNGVTPRRAVTVANSRRNAGRTEPWRTVLPREQHLDLFTQAGWLVERTVDGHSERSATVIARPGQVPVS